MVREEEVIGILDKNSTQQGGLIAILEGIQNRYGYLPREALQVVSRKTGKSLVDIYGVATFYRSFSLQPRGKHLISACLGTACHVRSAPMVAEEFERQLGIRAGGTTPDNEFTLETVNCLGACALGPIVVVDGFYHSKVNTAGVKRIVKEARQGVKKDVVKTDKRIFALDVNCLHCNHTLVDPAHNVDDQPSIRLTISFGDKHGWLRLSRLYGSYNIESKYEIPENTVVHFFCPHCHAELIGASNCVLCGASMVPMIVRGGGMIQICSRRGCRNHMLDLDGVNF